MAGMFYPGDPAQLAAMVDGMLAAARGVQPHARAIITPHAGLIYSGAIAAHAWRALLPVRRILMIGPAHRVPVEGLAAPSHDAFATPLGEIAVDDVLREAALAVGGVQVFDAAHAMEHSLEVQLPFIQRLMPQVSVLPLVAGSAPPSRVHAVLETAWNLADAAIAISSDLSHYLPDADARRIDAATIERILALENDIHGSEACGCVGINGLTLLARAQGLRGRLIRYANSGDASGDDSAVVGYAAISFTGDEA
ncbi:MAG: AmmeMemoRadiSam system protein B [Mariprofundaceae bacterium]